MDCLQNIQKKVVLWQKRPNFAPQAAKQGERRERREMSRREGKGGIGAEVGALTYLGI